MWVIEHSFNITNSAHVLKLQILGMGTNGFGLRHPETKEFLQDQKRIEELSEMLKKVVGKWKHKISYH